MEAQEEYKEYIINLNEYCHRCLDEDAQKNMVFIPIWLVAALTESGNIDEINYRFFSNWIKLVCQMKAEEDLKRLRNWDGPIDNYLFTLKMLLKGIEFVGLNLKEIGTSKSELITLIIRAYLMCTMEEG